MSTAGGPLHVIQHKPNVPTFFAFVSDDGKWIYFQSNDVKPSSFVIYRWNKETQQREVVFDQQEGIWSVADLRPDGRLLLEKSVGSHMNEYDEYSQATKTLTPLFGQGENEDYAAGYGADDSISPNMETRRRIATRCSSSRRSPTSTR